MKASFVTVSRRWVVVLGVGALAWLATSCARDRVAAPAPARAQVVGEVLVQPVEYVQDQAGGWSLVLQVSNPSDHAVECYAGDDVTGTQPGDRVEQLRELKNPRPPSTLAWVQRKPANPMDARMLRRYGLAEFFTLQPGESGRVTIPLLAPVKPTDSFQEYAVLGLKPAQSDAGYTTYLAPIPLP